MSSALDIKSTNGLAVEISEKMSVLTNLVQVSVSMILKPIDSIADTVEMCIYVISVVIHNEKTLHARVQAYHERQP